VTTATATTDYIITYATNHVNGTYNVWGVNFTTYNFNVNGSSCTTTSACHGGQAYWGGPKKTCADCHFGTADTDNYNFDDGFMAKISSATEYWVTGHGRSSTTYYDSKNRGAGIGPWRVTVSTADYCLYCHKKEGTSHGDSANFFRLRYSANATCLDCHNTGSSGVNPGAGFTNVNASTKVAGAHWGVKHDSETASNLPDGGKFCWDCHDPHGDYDLYGSTLGYMIQRFPVQLSSNTVPGVPAVVASTGVVFWSNGSPGGGADVSSYTYSDYVTISAVGGKYRGVCNVCHDRSVGIFCSTGSVTDHERSGEPKCTKNCHLHTVESFAPNCVWCHDRSTGTVVLRRAIVREATTTANWSHFRANFGKAPSTPVVTGMDCAVCHKEGNSDGFGKTYHKDTNKYIDLRNPDTGVVISSRPVSFKRNTSTNVIETYVSAVQNELCLKCHDSDGAKGDLTPFPSSTGTPVNVFAQFDPNNASYHPVRGKQNNMYCDVDSMKAPWTYPSKSTTTPGYLISCWDCHIATATAHGGPATLRATYYQAVSDAYTPLCVICHDDVNVYWHGATVLPTNKTAFDGSTTDACHPNNATTRHQVGDYAWDYGCRHCHSSGYADPGRRLRAQDVHGFNTTTAGGNWSSGAKPWGFLRNTTEFLDWRPKYGSGLTTDKGNCGTTTGTICGAATGHTWLGYTPGGWY